MVGSNISKRNKNLAEPNTFHFLGSVLNGGFSVDGRCLFVFGAKKIRDKDLFAGPAYYHPSTTNKSLCNSTVEVA